MDSEHSHLGESHNQYAGLSDPLQQVQPVPENRSASYTEDEHDHIESPRPQASKKPAVLASGRNIGDPERQPLLSPDDPGVSALNVSNVRLSRLLLNLLSFLSSIWFVLLLLSDFVSIPGFNNRGRSFLEINFILISLFSTASTLIFFQVPSKLERQLGYITAGLIALVMILLVSFERSDMSGIGFVSGLWCLLTVAFTSVSEYLVEEGKAQEEIRLTGRIETRRTLTEWLIVLFRNAMKSVLLIYTSFVVLNVLLHSFDVVRVKPWGEQVWVEDGAFTLHIACYGDVQNSTASKQPIVLMQAGHDSNEEFSEWVEELHHLNQIERYCIYDRPGYAFSDSSPSPISLSIVSDLLSDALRQLKIEGPFLVAGHDIGGLYSLVFAARNQAQVESIMLVDSWHEDLLTRNPSSRAKKNEPLPSEVSRMDPTTGFKLWLSGLFSPLGIPLQGSWIFKHRGSKDRMYGRDMKHQGKYIRARLQEQIGASILSYNEVINAKPSLVDIPVSVVSSDYMIKKSLNWGNWQRQLTKISKATYEWKVADGGHDIWRTPKGREQLQDALLRLIEK